MEENEGEIELIDFLNIIWKRKWLIILSTLFLVIAAGVISFFLPPKWEIDALIQPSKFLVKTGEGKFEENLIIDPKQIASQINQASYNNKIAAELNLDIRKIPKLKAEDLRDTNLVRISLKEKDVEKAKLILLSLFNLLKTEPDEKVDVEIKRIEGEIKSNKNKLNIIKQRREEIEKEMSDIRKRIEALEKEQSLSLKKKNRSESESLAMLLYSNEIQQSLVYHNTLNELLSSKKIEEENLNLEIENLNERKGRLDYAQLIKEPTSSASPVSPKKKLIVLITGVLGLLIFTMLAFFLEYLEKQKAEGKA